MESEVYLEWTDSPLHDRCWVGSVQCHLLAIKCAIMVVHFLLSWQCQIAEYKPLPGVCACASCGNRKWLPVGRWVAVCSNSLDCHNLLQTHLNLAGYPRVMLYIMSLCFLDSLTCRRRFLAHTPQKDLVHIQHAEVGGIITTDTYNTIVSILDI